MNMLHIKPHLYRAFEKKLKITSSVEQSFQNVKEKLFYLQPRNPIMNKGRETH